MIPFISKMTVFHLERQTLSKNIKNVLIKKSTFPILPPEPWECKIFINIINIIVLINVAPLMKKIQDSSINSKKLVFYITKILCHHIEHTLFYLWLQYELI